MSTSPATAGPAPRLPRFEEFRAPPQWRAIDFISDLHLQASQPATCAAFEAHLLHTSADAVMILGDLFEAWVGDDARDGAFERGIVETLHEAASRRRIAFMAGNRDFLVGSELLGACGMTALPDPTVLLAFGERVLLTHGDALCLEDTAYQRFRAEVRTEAWRDAFLARPLAERRSIAERMREASRAHQAGQREELWADVDAAAAVQWMRATGTSVMVHGHTHRPGDQVLAPGFMRMVLTDWECDRGSQRAGVLRLSERGFERVAPATGS
ncbi:UDP-2,3-diacylglucosamine diphosphatase [Caldimonas sp. KR1-144]|uniref:UDP-2,3-diacylglucosamine diphosphatase n=1 Tax=Caldimonas sp. KR1-144 TaxID=3400911 RepID=UPI003BFCC04D